MSQTDAIQLLQQQTTESAQPRLTLAVETPSSASPFPSPSSTFFPPPIPSSHEFANRIMNNKRYRAKSVGNKDRDKEKPRDLKLSLTTGDAAPATADAAAALSDGTPKLPSTRSAGASPLHVTHALPAFTAPDTSSTTTSGLSPSLSTPLGAPSIPSSSVSVSPVSQSVTTIAGVASNSLVSLVSPATRDSSISTSATAVQCPVTDDNMTTRPADGANTFASPQLHHPLQPPSPYDALLKLYAQTSSAGTLTLAPTSLTVPQHSEAEQDTNNDGASTPVARRRPESGTSLSMALGGPGSLSRASSLSSSRPAPPSPVPSRRASQQILRRNPSLRRSTSSIASGTGGANLGRSTSMRSTANRRSSTFSMTSLAPPIDTTAPGLQVTALSPTVEQPSPAVEGGQPPRPIIVRDFAYVPEDYWFGARPVELLPRSERESNRDSSASRLSSGLGGWVSYSSSSKPLGAKSGKKKKKGGWAALGKFLSKRSSGQPESGSEDPSEGHDDEDEGPYEDGDDAAGADSGYDDDDAGGGEQVEEELKPGIYRALYAFEPEGTAEMALVEDQFVRVIARGGGVGWAIVQRPSEKGEGVGSFGLEAAGQALVPESYLEPFRLDDEGEDEYDD